MTSIFSDFGSFSEQELRTIELCLEQREIHKGESLLLEGDVCRTFFYLDSGACFQYNINEKGDTVIHDLHSPGQWCTNYSSFIAQKPSLTTIEVYTSGRIRALSMHAIHHLIALSQKYFRLGKILAQATTRTEILTNYTSPLEKYQYILTSRPDLLEHFPLKFIASYLNITPETLSRIRRKIT